MKDKCSSYPCLLDFLVGVFFTMSYLIAVGRWECQLILLCQNKTLAQPFTSPFLRSSFVKTTWVININKSFY